MKRLLLSILISMISLLPQLVWADKTHDDVIKTFSQKTEVIAAMKEFSETFGQFRSDNGLESVDELKKSLFSFYEENFAKEYKNTVGKQPDMKVAKLIDDDAVALQYYYISQNNSKIGEKNHFLDAKDKSKWTKAHVTHHELIEKFTHEDNGFYDLFLIDLSGRIVYSVFKEIDFATSLVNGPYSNSSLGTVFKDLKDATIGITKTSESIPYFPSVEDNTQFVGTSIFEGDKKIGIVVVQLPSW